MKTLKILFFVLVATLLLSKVSLAGITIYVEYSEDPGTEDGSEANPYNTIQEGINASSDGDTVSVLEGEYNEAVNINKRITLEGAGWGYSIINSPASGDNDGLFITVDDVTLTGFKITASEVSFRNISISSNEATRVHITNNWISSNAHGVDVLGTVPVTISGNIFTSCNYAGVGVSANNADVTITNNTFDSNSNGSQPQNSGGTITFKNNIFSNHTNGAAISDGSTHTLVIDYNHYFNSGGDGSSHLSQGLSMGSGATSGSNPAYIQTSDATAATFYALPDFSVAAIGGASGDLPTHRGAIAYSGTPTTTINYPEDISSIATAITAAGSEYIISIAAGHDHTLSEMVNMSVANVTLQGAGRDLTTLTADFTGGVIQITASDVTIDGLKIVGQASGDGSALIMAQANATIQNCFLLGDTNEDTYKGIEFNGNNGAVTATITNNIIVSAGRSIFFNGQSNAVDGSITNNTLYGGYLGFQIDTAGTVEFKDNIVANHAAAGVAGSDGPEVTITYTDSYNNNDEDFPEDVELDAETGNKSEDPLFLAAASNDFRIIAVASPCYGTGSADGSHMGALLTPVDQFSPVYVDASADAGGDGSSLDSPLTSIATCLNLTSSVCEVAAGTYNENITMRSNITLAGAGASSTTIQGSGSTHVVTFSSISNATLQGFTISGTSDGLNNIYVSDSENITILDSIISDYSITEASGGYFATELGELIYAEGEEEEEEYADVCGEDVPGICADGFMLLAAGGDPIAVYSSDTAISALDGESNLLLCLCSASHLGLGDIFEPVFLSADDFPMFNNATCTGDLGEGDVSLAELLFEGDDFSGQSAIGFGEVLLAQGEDDYAWQDSSFEDRAFDAESVTPEIEYVSGGGYAYAGIYLDSATNFKMQNNDISGDGTDINLASGTFHSESCGNEYTTIAGDVPTTLEDECSSAPPPSATEVEDCDDVVDNDGDGDVDYCDSDCVDECSGTIVLCACVNAESTPGSVVPPAASPLIPSGALPSDQSSGGASTGGGDNANSGLCTFTAKPNNQMSSFGMLLLIVLIGLAALRRKN